MNAEEQARALWARAIATDDPDELDEILAQLNALLHEHIAKLQTMMSSAVWVWT